MATYAIEEIDGESYYSRLSLVDIDSKLYKFQETIKTYCSPIKEVRWSYYLTKVWHESKKKIHCKTMDMLENFEIAEDAPRYKETSQLRKNSSLISLGSRITSTHLMIVVYLIMIG